MREFTVNPSVEMVSFWWGSNNSCGISTRLLRAGARFVFVVCPWLLQHQAQMPLLPNWCLLLWHCCSWSDSFESLPSVHLMMVYQVRGTVLLPSWLILVVLVLRKPNVLQNFPQIQIFVVVQLSLLSGFIANNPFGNCLNRTNFFGLFTKNAYSISLRIIGSFVLGSHVR